MQILFFLSKKEYIVAILTHKTKLNSVFVCLFSVVFILVCLPQPKYICNTLFQFPHKDTKVEKVVLKKKSSLAYMETKSPF